MNKVQTQNNRKDKAMNKSHETYCIASMEVNDIMFYILEIHSWGRTGVSIYGSKEEALEQVTRTENFIHDKLTETHKHSDWMIKISISMVGAMD